MSQLFDLVLTTEEGRSAASGYLLQDKLLVRKWLPHGDSFVDNPVFQVVVPSKFRGEVLKTAHDQSGHLGVRKTYKYLLRYFFWHCVRRDVSGYIRMCHTCQMTGKPNQGIPPAPLYLIPVVEQPFEHLIIACVSPPPRSKSGSSYLLTVMCQSPRVPYSSASCPSSHSKPNPLCPRYLAKCRILATFDWPTVRTAAL